MRFRLSIVLSLQPASFAAMVYRGGLEEDLGRIKALGYDGVELAIRDPGLLDRGRVLSALDAAGLPVPAIGTGQAFGEEGLSFTDPDRTVRARAVARMHAHVPLAQKLGAVLIIGLIRGRSAGALAAAEAEELILGAVQDIAGGHPEQKFAIEPINRYETGFINTVDAGLRFLDRLKLENVGLLLDTFHMNIEEPSMTQSISMAGERIFHFHIADSNRWHPDAGHIDFGAVIEALDRAGYRGWLSAEILPLPDADSAARSTIVHMRKFA
ncbi:MAG TPA: 5-keto-L-gluconate epimerase [bacterium]|nr:5-keto-L-gluconate epimerase [bacterium]